MTFAKLFILLSFYLFFRYSYLDHCGWELQNLKFKWPRPCLKWLRWRSKSIWSKMKFFECNSGKVLSGIGREWVLIMWQKLCNFLVLKILMYVNSEKVSRYMYIRSKFPMVPDEQKSKQTNRQTNKWTREWMGRWMDGCTERQADRQTDRQTDRPTDRQANRQTGQTLCL